MVASIAAANGLFHAWAVVRSRRYSPGVVTGVMLYLPLAVFGFTYLESRPGERAADSAGSTDRAGLQYLCGVESPAPCKSDGGHQEALTAEFE